MVVMSHSDELVVLLIFKHEYSELQFIPKSLATGMITDIPLSLLLLSYGLTGISTRFIPPVLRRTVTDLDGPSRPT